MVFVKIMIIYEKLWKSKDYHDFHENHDLSPRKFILKNVRTGKNRFVDFFCFYMIDTFPFQKYDAAVLQPLKKYVT